MIEEWKIRQEIYHRLNRNYVDDLKNQVIHISKNISEDAIKYFNEKNLGWVYPSKSYMVGICYAKWISRYFGGEPINYLNCPDLLFNNDPYFIPYDEDKKTYNKILNAVTWSFDEQKGMVPDVKKYFLEEFMINE